MEGYSYAELKRAQAQCGDRAAEQALEARESSSEAQREVFRAHVTDLCASVFTAVLRQYDPVSKGNLEPVDAALVARVAEMEKALMDKEEDVQELRESVPRLAAMKTRERLEQERKRKAQVLVVAPVSAESSLELSEESVEAMRQSVEKTASCIASAATKVDRIRAQTSETIHVVERAMKRPKTAIDRAMEKSPAKLNFATRAEGGETANEPTVGSLRSRLALQLCPAKNA